MRKKICCVFFATALCLGLCACTKMPNLSANQEELVSEYAAALLLKYDSANHSRLVDISEIVEQYENAHSNYIKDEKDYYDKLSEEERKRIEEAKLQEQLNKEYADKTTVTDISEGESGYQGNNSVVVDGVSISEFLGIDGFSIDYAGSDTLSMYPDNDEVIDIVMTPTNGKDLLVVYFNVHNNGTEAANLNIYGKRPTFKLSVNGGDFHTVETTILADDLSTFNGEIAGGDFTRLVLISEVKKGTTVSKLDMRVVAGERSLEKSLR